MHAVEFFSRIPKPLTFVKTFFIAYGTRTFQYAVHSSKSPVSMSSQNNAVHNINTRKTCFGNAFVMWGDKN